MIKRILLVVSSVYNPYSNLALEEALFENVDDETLVFYLWQNQHTVVIGKNQNAYKECKVVDLSLNNGTLARRLSGGGAVYHDLGNLNFTFLMQSTYFDVQKQCSVLITALKKLGIEAYAQGRNDLLVDGKKFSGHAYYHHNQKSYHHGTLMVNVDFSQLSKYLNVSRQKLKGKGVTSVVSRVTNLSDYHPHLTIEDLKEALITSIKEEYNVPIEFLEQHPDISSLYEKYASDQWLLNPDFDASYETSNRFDWGEISILLDVKDHRIMDVEVYTDAMDTGLAPTIKQVLKNELFTQQSIETALDSLNLSEVLRQDIRSLFRNEKDPFQ